MTMDNTLSDLSDALSTNYMQADLTLPVWQGTKSDRVLADELAANKGAERDSATVIKRLLKGNAELKDCVQAHTRIRTWFYANTLTMGRGLYVVPVNKVMDFLTDFDKLKREAGEAKDKLVEVYDDAVEHAKLTLGSMFDASNYPDKSELRHLFGAKLDVRPVPAVADYDRLAIPSKLAAGLKGLYARQAQMQADAAIEDLQARLLAELNRMATQLGKVAKGEKTRLYKSLITNMEGLVELARGLGPIDNGQLSSLADEIEQKLLANNLDDYRDNSPLARAVADHAEQLAGRLTGSPADKEEVNSTDTDDQAPQVSADFNPDEVYY